jgi:hypothetical protein
MIRVVGQNDNEVTLTERYDMIYKYLNKGKAIVICKNPFTVKLVKPTKNLFQDKGGTHDVHTGIPAKRYQQACAH